MKKLLLILIILSSLLSVLTGTVFAAPSWVEAQPAGNIGKQWNILATSSNGQKVVAGIYDGRLYISSDGGATWAETRPAGNQDGGWQALDMSPDGQKIVVGNYGGRLYLSTNGGNSWSETQPAGNTAHDWIAASISDDGQKILAANFQRRLYITSNGGSSWSETQPAGNADFEWYAVSVSGNGQTLFAGVNPGRLYISTNGGSSWSETQPAGNTNQTWRSITTSYDGQTAFVVIDSGINVYKTTNQASSWAIVKPAGNTNPYLTTISMSSNTQTVLGTGANDKLYLSYDGGSTWVEDTLISSADFGWNTGILSEDGTHLYVGEWIGRLYRGTISSVARVSSSNATNTSFTPASAPSCTDITPTGTVDLFQINRNRTTTQLFFTPAHNTDRYHVVYGYYEGDERFGVLSQQTTGSSGVQSISIHGLNPRSSYWFKVVPVNGCATGKWSNWLQAGTTENKKIFYRY